MSRLPKAVQVLALVFFPAVSLAQISPGAISGQVVQPAPPAGTGGPAPSATVRVCPVSGSGLPCSPLASLFSDSALTQALPNPYTTDQYGNYSFYLTAGFYIVQVGATPTVTYNYPVVAASATGTVTSVGLALPAGMFTITGSPVTQTGTLTGAFAAQNGNTVFGNCTGGSAVPSFCTLSATQVPWATPGTIGSTTPNTGAFTTLSATGQITSTLGTGTAPFSVASTTIVPSLNVGLLQGQTWAVPGTIGSSVPKAGRVSVTGRRLWLSGASRLISARSWVVEH